MTGSGIDESTNTDVAAGGTWDSLKNRIFAILLLVNLFATMAVFRNGLAAAWALTDITDSPALVEIVGHEFPSIAAHREIKLNATR